MRQPFDSVLPETDPRHHHRRRPRARAPLVEKISGWSARHRKTAVFGWLFLVAAVFVIAQLAGSRSLPSYDPGQAGQAERALHQVSPNYGNSSTETVLIQSRT